MTNSLDFLSSIQKELTDVESLMRTQANGHHADLQAALNHILSAGGKRIRPAITLLVGKMLNGPVHRLVTLGAALELLHTATLVHDDLIDNSLLRRGLPTLNSKWSAGATVLTGDFLFACAAELATDVESIPVMKVFARTTAIIANGEIAQMFTGRCTVSRENYDQRIYAKTASLFESAAMTAALLCDVSKINVQAAKEYGYNLGMAFQIIDDILDFTGDQTTVGKPIGSDLRQGLVTLPSLYYIESHPEESECHQLLEHECLQGETSVNGLVERIRQSDSIAKAHIEAEVFADKAISALNIFPDSAEKRALVDLARYIVTRKK